MAMRKPTTVTIYGRCDAMTSCVLLTIGMDSVPNSPPPNIAISPFDDEFGPRVNPYRRRRSPAALLRQTAPSVLFQHPVEAAQMFVLVALALCQVQGRVRARVDYAPVHHPGELDAVHVGGDDGDADPRGDQTDDGRGFEHLSDYSRTKSGRRAQIHDLPVDPGTRLAGIHDEGFILEIGQRQRIGCGARMIFRDRCHQRGAVPLDDVDSFWSAHVDFAQHAHIERTLAQFMKLFE